MKRTILIVDDNRRNIDIIARLLKADYELLTAESGERALEIAAETRPDIVLLDIMMPGINGYDVCRSLRARSEFSSTKIIMVSAKAMTSERLKGYAAGADDYVTKPFDLDELEAKVKVYARLSSEETTKITIAALLKNLSTRIGTPLSYLQDAADLLNNDESIQGSSRELLQIVCQSTATIRAADNEIKLLSKLELGDTTPNLMPANPEALLQRALAKVEWLKIRKGCLIESQCVGNGFVLVDEDMTVHAIGALVELALRRSTRGGRITTLLTVGETCRFEVRIESPLPGASFLESPDASIICRIIHLVADIHGGSIIMSAPGDAPVSATITIPTRVETTEPSPEPLSV